MAKFQLIDNSASIVPDSDFFDKIAFVAHNCYQVKTKDHQANVEFIGRLLTGGHLAMIEHFRYLFKVSKEAYEGFKELYNRFYDLALGVDGTYYVSCSVRPLLEAKDSLEKKLDLPLISALPPDVKNFAFKGYQDEKGASLADIDKEKGNLKPLDYDNLKYVTYNLITDRGVTHEIVRHRLCSFAQESTRYCNYTKDKFSNELTFMKPLRYDEFSDIYNRYYQEVSDTYFDLIAKGAKPDEARSVLPNSLRASIMVTCSLTEWKHIFELRCSEFAHPDIKRLMSLVRDDMKDKNIL